MVDCKGGRAAAAAGGGAAAGANGAAAGGDVDGVAGALAAVQLGA
jgi:hypothetical protein